MNEQARPKAIARRITRPRKARPKLENEYVASAAEKVQQIAHAAGLQSTSLVWNTACKGIDDWQLALRQEETKEKEA